MREGSPLPKAMQNAPELHLGLELFFNAFLDLNTERNSGWSEGPIGWLAIEAYCDRLGLEDEDRLEMHAHLGAMDAELAAWRKERRDKK